MRKLIAIVLCFALMPTMAMAVEKEKAYLLDGWRCLTYNPIEHPTHHSTYVGEYPEPTKELAEYMKEKKCVIQVIADFDNWGPSLRFDYYCQEPCGWSYRGTAHFLLEPDFYFNNTDNGAL